MKISTAPPGAKKSLRNLSTPISISAIDTTSGCGSGQFEQQKQIE